MEIKDGVRRQASIERFTYPGVEIVRHKVLRRERSLIGPYSFFTTVWFKMRVLEIMCLGIKTLLLRPLSIRACYTGSSPDSTLENGCVAGSINFCQKLHRDNRDDSPCYHEDKRSQ